jgi:hypothetical protein
MHERQVARVQRARPPCAGDGDPQPAHRCTAATGARAVLPPSASSVVS